MANLIQNIVIALKSSLSKELIVFLISLMPLLELRGGMIAGSLLGLPYIKAVVLCIIGNVLPIPIILFFLNKIFAYMERVSFLANIVKYFKNKAVKNKSKIDKYGFWGLVLFVGIPIPGTGAWTGALVASVFNMDIKKSIISIFLGIILAFIIMSIISYGFLGNIIR